MKAETLLLPLGMIVFVGLFPILREGKWNWEVVPENRVGTIIFWIGWCWSVVLLVLAVLSHFELVSVPIFKRAGVKNHAAVSHQLATDYWRADWRVNTWTAPKVHYTYADGLQNTIRPTGLVYPNGRQITLDYGTTGGMDDAASRVVSLVDSGAGSTHVVDYSYLGLATFVAADYTEPEIQWTLVDLAGSNRRISCDDGKPERYFCGRRDQRCDTVTISITCDRDMTTLMTTGRFGAHQVLEPNQYTRNLCGLSETRNCLE